MLTKSQSVCSDFFVVQIYIRWVILLKLIISPLAVISAAIMFAFGYGKVVILSYFVMTVHELAHLAAAVYIGLRAEKITFSVFGVHLTLKSRIIHTMSDEIILYAAGPLANAIMALIAIILGYHDLYIMNTVLMIMNIMPVLPLDGGIITRRILSDMFGRRCAEYVLKSFSATIAAAFTSLCIMGIYNGVINPSMLTAALLLFINAFTSHEFYRETFINGISGCKKRTSKIKPILVDSEHSMLDAARHISPAYTVVAFVNDGGEIRLMEERDIIMSISDMDL